MILDDRDDNAAPRATLDGLFRRAGVRHPDAPALIDAPNRTDFTDGAPRAFTYAQADRAISAIAGRLRALNLPTDAVVALQLPNTVESVLAMLGVMRAGMIAAPLPLLWHRQDAVAALSRVGAKAILTCARAGSVAQAEIAMQVAADLFPIRHVCAFGADLPDGVVPLDDLLTGSAETPGSVSRAGHAAAHVAAVTFEVAAAGIVAVARDHRQIIAGGIAPHLAARIAADARILSTLPVGSFAGMATTLAPWLISGGTLVLHHGFDADAFAAQCRAHDPDIVVLPGPALTRIAEAGHLDRAKAVLALWRTPERLVDATLWRRPAALVDVMGFGEIGVAAGRRDADGFPAPLGHRSFDHGSISPEARAAANADPLTALATLRSAAGTLCLRGPMVPTQAFPPGAERGPDPHLAPDAAGFVDTGLPCWLADDGRSLIVTGAPAGVTAVGSYRMLSRELDRLAHDLAAENAGLQVTLAALPQELTGQRLAGEASEREEALRALRDLGANPLITAAFRKAPAADAA